VKAFLDDAHKNGNVIAGGAAMDRPGYFIEPTIVRDIKEGSKLVDEEQFGPVLPVIKYSDKDDVIRRANATTYRSRGLGVVLRHQARPRGCVPDRGRHGVDQQAPRFRGAYPVRRRQAVEYRH
jgi:acyl-CoA reductase-like NAD-dependent aldehyde dehydrogenase